MLICALMQGQPAQRIFFFAIGDAFPIYSNFSAGNGRFIACGIGIACRVRFISTGQANKNEELLVLGTKTVDGKVWYQVMRTSGGDKMWIASWYTEKSGNSTFSAVLLL